MLFDRDRTKPRRRHAESVVAAVATFAASRHKQIVPCRIISNASHASVSRLVADSGMCFDTVADKAFENVFCINAVLRLPTKNRFSESSQRVIQPLLVRCEPPKEHPKVLRQMVSFHLNQLGYSAAEMAKLLCLNPQEFLEMYRPEVVGDPPDSRLKLRIVK